MNDRIFPGAKVLIKHPERNELLMVRREITHLNLIGYEPAGGGVHIDFEGKRAETLEACAKREALEELNLEVTIADYLGNYHLFWHVQPEVCSYCLVFKALINSPLEALKTTPCDQPGYYAYPEWVSIADIKTGKLPIMSNIIGLDALLQRAVHTHFSH